MFSYIASSFGNSPLLGNSVKPWVIYLYFFYSFLLICLLEEEERISRRTVRSHSSKPIASIGAKKICFIRFLNSILDESKERILIYISIFFLRFLQENERLISWFFSLSSSRKEKVIFAFFFHLKRSRWKKKETFFLFFFKKSKDYLKKRDNFFFLLFVLIDLKRRF